MRKYLLFSVLVLFLPAIAICKTGDDGEEQAMLLPVDFQDGKYNICENFPATWLFMLRFPYQENAGDIEIILELPEGLKCLGSSTMFSPDYFNKDVIYQNYLDKIKSENFTRNKMKYSRYVISVNPIILKLWRREPRIDRIYLEAAAGMSGKRLTAYWSVNYAGEKIRENTVQIEILPPLNMPAKKCSTFNAAIMKPASLTSPLPHVRDAYIDYWLALQKKLYLGIFMGPDTLRWNKETLEFCKRKDFEIMAIPSMNGNTLSCFWKLKDIPEAISPDGKKISGSLLQISPWYLIDDPKGILWDKTFPEYMKEIRKMFPTMTALLIDYEPGIKDECYSTENREKFREFTKLAAVPEISEIKEKYRIEWRKFRRKQSREINEKIAGSLKRCMPEIKYSLCTTPVRLHGNKLADWCLIDAEDGENVVDLNTHMIYCSGTKFFDTLELNMKKLKKPFIPMLDPNEYERRYCENYTPLLIKQNIVASAALGAKGIAFWPNDCFDGLYLQEICRSFDIISQAEDFYSAGCCPADNFNWNIENVSTKIIDDDGKKIELSYPDLYSNLRILTHRKEKDWLLTLFNYNKKSPVFVTVKIPEIPSLTYQVTDIETSSFFTLRKHKDIPAEILRTGLLLEVPPDGVKVIKILSTRTAHTAQSVLIPLESIHEKLASIKKKQDALSVFPVMSEGNARIAWTQLSTFGKTPLLKLVQSNTKVILDADANLVSWRPANCKHDILYSKEYGSLGELMLYENTPAIEFKLDSISIDKNNPSVTFKSKVPDQDGANPEPLPLSGLEISKKSQLDNKGTEYIVEYEFRNNHPQKADMKLGFRIRNIPRFGGYLAGKSPLMSITQFSFQSGTGVIKLENLSKNNIFTGTKTYTLPICSKDDVKGKYDGDPLCITVGKTIPFEKLLIHSSDKIFEAVYFFIAADESFYTVEFLSRIIHLKYGESIRCQVSYLKTALL
ncbi:MAG: hypothetical protein A2017_15515 [Lentisphaerae bacterium GWF2_44_16]|nr:MAG: hypothetical protein A2017_15515 [Lentisphaerae bacterium GWF2_44_16]